MHTALHRNKAACLFLCCSRQDLLGINERQAFDGRSRSFGGTQKEETAHIAEIQAKDGLQDNGC